jgi:hypothetical protein
MLMLRIGVFSLRFQLDRLMEASLFYDWDLPIFCRTSKFFSFPNDFCLSLEKLPSLLLVLEVGTLALFFKSTRLGL